MSGPLADDAVPKLKRLYRFQWEEAQNTYVLLYPEGMIKLNDSAGEILKHCDGEKTLAEVIQSLKDAFPGADLEADVRKFFEVANDNGWLQP